MDLEQTAIARLKEAAKMSLQVYQKPLIVTTSGGKDSAVCVALAERAGIPFEILHNHTTADAPETVHFIREEFRRLEAKRIKCTIEYPAYKGKRVSMWSLIPQKLIPPTQTVRYCCSILKENGRTAVPGDSSRQGYGGQNQESAWAGGYMKHCAAIRKRKSF